MPLCLLNSIIFCPEGCTYYTAFSIHTDTSCVVSYIWMSCTDNALIHVHINFIANAIQILIILFSPEDNGELICCNTPRHLNPLQSGGPLHSDATYDVMKLRPNSSPVATRDDGDNVWLTEKCHNLLFIGCRENRENGWIWDSWYATYMYIHVFRTMNNSSDDETLLLLSLGPMMFLLLWG